MNKIYNDKIYYIIKFEYYSEENMPWKKLVTFTKEVDQRFAGKNIQLVTISKPKAYNEYAPYKMVDSEDEFIKQIAEM